MKTLLITFVTIACVGSLKAELGETPAQFETGKPARIERYENNVVAMVWEGKSVMHAGVFDSNKCVMEAFSFVDNRKMVIADFERFLAPYFEMPMINKRQDEKGNYRFLADKNGKITTVVAYFHEGNRLQVMTLDFWNAVFEEDTKDTPQPVVAQPSSTPNDCLVVATEVYGRLRTNAHWARIISFYWSLNGEQTGHAVVTYQPTPTSNVFLYDKAIGGSKDLGIQSHDLAEIVNSIKSIMKAGVTIEEPQWID